MMKSQSVYWWKVSQSVYWWQVSQFTDDRSVSQSTDDRSVSQSTDDRSVSLLTTCPTGRWLAGLSVVGMTAVISAPVSASATGTKNVLENFGAGEV